MNKIINFIKKWGKLVISICGGVYAAKEIAEAIPKGSVDTDVNGNDEDDIIEVKVVEDDEVLEELEEELDG